MQVEATLGGFGALRRQHGDVAGKTRALAAGCERLVAEEGRLAGFAAAVRARLGYFDELERLSAQLHAGAAAALDAERLLPVLARLDECITCVGNPRREPPFKSCK